MKYLFAALLLLSHLYGKLLTLDDDNFEHLTQASTGSTTGVHMVMFYAPWCPHCAKALPIFESVAQKYIDEPENNVLGFVFGKVNNDESKKTAKRLTVEKVPTILIFRNNRLLEYSESISEKDLKHFIEEGMLDIPRMRWEKVPPELSWSEILFETAVHDIDVITEKYAIGTLIMFLTGVVVGLFVGRQFCSKSSRGKVKTS